MKSRLPQGYGTQNKSQMMSQLQKMQEGMANAQAELEATIFTAAAGGGAVEVSATGKKKIEKITISPDVVDPEDIEMLEDLITAAVNEVMNQIDKSTEEKMGAFTGGLNIPGIL